MTDAPSSPAIPDPLVPAPVGSIPASAVIAEFLRVQSGVAPRTPAARLFGRSPLSTESRSWYLGALGELDVAARLDRLGPGWSVLHSVPIGTRGSDIDHIVAGPAGVFTINTKFHEGANIWVGSRRLLINGQKTDHLRNTRYEAQRVSRLLEQKLSEPIPVTGIIALVGIRRLTFKSRPEGAVVLRARELVGWLKHQPLRLSTPQLVSVASVVSSSTTWGAAGHAPNLHAFMELRAATERARWVRIRWALATLFGGALALLAASQVLPVLLR